MSARCRCLSYSNFPSSFFFRYSQFIPSSCWLILLFTCSVCFHLPLLKAHVYCTLWKQNSNSLTPVNLDFLPCKKLQNVCVSWVISQGNFFCAFISFAAVGGFNSDWMKRKEKVQMFWDYCQNKNKLPDYNFLISIFKGN